jgi:electron transport complex protein RnfB
MALVLACLAIMAVLGGLFGIGLAIAGKAFHVETDPRIEQVVAALPGVNCGACGFAGCEGYATAVATAGAPPNLCAPGGPDAARRVAHIMGVEMDAELQPVRAVVHCQGGSDRSALRFNYNGIPDCQAAHMVQAGPKACEYGCLGFGACATACPFDAIVMGPDRIPVVDWDKCTGCGACVRACPRHLIETLPINIPHYVACSSQDKGKAVKDACKVGCIACWLCVKASPEGAIEKNGNLPRLAYPSGVDYAAAMEKCPMHCFVKVEPPMVSRRSEPVETAAV